jgi:hypothetical protein
LSQFHREDEKSGFQSLYDDIREYERKVMANVNFSGSNDGVEYFRIRQERGFKSNEI